MKRHWSQILGLPILTLAEGTHVGYLTAVFFDPETGKILAFKAGFAKVFSPTDVQAWHSNRIELSDMEALVPPEEISRLRNFGLKRSRLFGKKVQTRDGTRLGRVYDFCMDSTTSSLLSIEVCKSFLWWQWDSKIFPFSAIQEIQENAVILNVEPEQKVKAKAQTEKSQSAVRLTPASTSSGH